MSFDYIIIGGGTTGCVLANRLSENPQNKVLLLEAGSENRSFLFSVPAAQARLVNDPKYDWRYVTQPDATRNNREELWASGKGLGGGSAINGMIYIRGEPSDYDHWQALGNKGWSYEELLPYFRKAEHHIFGESHYHGTNGPVNVSDVRSKHALSQLFVKAGVEIGLTEKTDFNAHGQEGIGFYHVNQKQGRRCSVVSAYINPIKNRQNLKILTNAYVTKILIKNNQAIGVEYLQDDKKHQVYCNCEVVLSAGAVASPKILLLSGIGPRNHLTSLGIKITHDLPGVGLNLQEHPAIILSYFTTMRSLNMELTPIRSIIHTLNWILFGNGPLSTPVAQAAAYIKTNSELQTPDIQIGFTPLGFALNPDGLAVAKKSMFMLAPTLLRPKSRGTILLKSTDPLDYPKIDYPFFANTDDLKTLIAGCKQARKILASKTFSPYSISEQAPTTTVQSDNDWENYLRQSAVRSFHPAGTCKMGHDAMSVVDENLKVHGVTKLRIADASIMPTITSGNLTSPCIMIGEKAADLILTDPR